MGEQMTPSFKLWTLFASVYEEEKGRQYGRMPRDFGDAKKWLQLYPEFWEDEELRMQFMDTSRNYLRSNDEFATKKKHPMWLMLFQYNEWIPAKKKSAKVQMAQFEDCPECLRAVQVGTKCEHCEREKV